MSTYHKYVDIPSLMSIYQRYTSSWYHLILWIVILQWLCRHTITYANIPKIYIFTISFNIINSDTWISLSTYQLRNNISYHYTMHIRINNTKSTITISSQYNKHIHTFSITVRYFFISLNKRSVKVFRINFNICI